MNVPLAVSRAVYYDIPIELIRVIHNLCEPEGYGEFRIADGRLTDHGRFVSYKQSQLVTVTVETQYVYKAIYTTFRGKFHGEYKNWHENGPPVGGVAERLQLHTQSYYAHGKRHGEYKQWYSCGRLSQQHFYVRDELHGEYKRWYYNGQLHIQTSYVNGMNHGEHKEWHYSNPEQLQLRMHTFYAHNKLHGEYKEWRENGQLYTRTIYVDGKIHGKYREYDKNGRICRLKIYYNGKERE